MSCSPSCVFAPRSVQPCGPKRSLNHPLQTLDEIDASTLNCPGGKAAVKISWLILSRAGINYLSNSDYYGKWVICYNHRREFLDSWQLSKSCSYPDHNDEAETEDAKNMVTLVMAVKVLQKERKVMPISGKICDACKAIYDKNYPPTSGNVVLMIPKNIQPLPVDNLMMPSPFCAAPETAEIASAEPPELSRNIPVHDASNPTLTLKTEVLDPGEEEITLKEEAIDVDAEDNEGSGLEESEESEGSLFSEDSDDDRTWSPGEGNKRQKLNDERRVPKSVVIEKPVVSSSSHFFCKVCKITFYKQSSYRQHVRSSKDIHREVMQKRVRQQQGEEGEEYECGDCSIAFMDRTSMAAHMATAHGKAQGEKSFFCEKCQVYMKNSSAFKSHNSKLHLERRQKSYYCRECDETFKCKEAHRKHIKTHMLWSGQEPCLQCLICGKVFSSKQHVPYTRHMATHDSEPNQDCTCPSCSTTVMMTDDGGKAKEDLCRSKANAHEVTADKGGEKMNLFRQMQSNFVIEETDEEEEEEEGGEAGVADLSSVTGQYQCAVCKDKFEAPDDLEAHVLSAHQKTPKEVATEQKTEKLRPRVFSSSSNNGSSSLGDIGSSRTMGGAECDRNWAAEFGYGGKKVAAPKSGDLLSRMKMKFTLPGDKDGDCGGDSGGDENDVSDEFNLYRTRGFKGTVKASPKKSPRTLSNSSLTTRKRMEALIRRAREHQEMLRKTKSRSAGEKLLAGQTPVECGEAEDDEEEDFEGFEDEDDSLLIPLQNGWVCEKKPKNKDKTEYKTSFWSPEGDQFQSLKEIERHLRQNKVENLDITVFERALKKNPNKVMEPPVTTAGAGEEASRCSRFVLSRIIVDNIIDEEETDEATRP